MLDPFFRTVSGFQTLLVKEWLDFGHQFALRCGTIAPIERGGGGRRSPRSDLRDQISEMRSPRSRLA
jgi:hypothetical protein